MYSSADFAMEMTDMATRLGIATKLDERGEIDLPELYLAFASFISKHQNKEKQMYKIEDLSKLGDFFPPSSVSWRAGTANHDKTSCLPLAYIDARDVQDRLDAVVGPDNWRTEFHDSPGGGVMCALSIRVPREDGTSEWVTKMDGADQTQFEAVKGGLSDAFKRAAVHWGIGRYLYGMKSPWVACTARGNTVSISKEGYKQLDDFLKEWYAKNAKMAVEAPEKKDKKDEKTLLAFSKSLGITPAMTKDILEAAGFSKFDVTKYDEMLVAITNAAAKLEG